MTITQAAKAKAVELANWKAGKYPSISPDRAKWYAEVTRA